MINRTTNIVKGNASNVPGLDPTSSRLRWAILLDSGAGKLAKRIKANSSKLSKRLDAYFQRLPFPLYLFPIKLLTYTAYYLVKFSISLVISLVKVIIDSIIYPFRGLKNFLKSILSGVYKMLKSKIKEVEKPGWDWFYGY